MDIRKGSFQLLERLVYIIIYTVAQLQFVLLSQHYS